MHFSSSRSSTLCRGSARCSRPTPWASTVIAIASSRSRSRAAAALRRMRERRAPSPRLALSSTVGLLGGRRRCCGPRSRSRSAPRGGGGGKQLGVSRARGRAGVLPRALAATGLVGIAGLHIAAAGDEWGDTRGALVAVHRPRWVPLARGPARVRPRPLGLGSRLIGGRGGDRGLRPRPGRPGSPRPPTTWATWPTHWARRARRRSRADRAHRERPQRATAAAARFRPSGVNQEYSRVGRVARISISALR